MSDSIPPPEEQPLMNMFRRWEQTKPTIKESTLPSDQPESEIENAVGKLRIARDQLLEKINKIKEENPEAVVKNPVNAPEVPAGFIALPLDISGNPSSVVSVHGPEGLEFLNGIKYFSYNSPFISREGEQLTRECEKGLDNDEWLKARLDFHHIEEKRYTRLSISQIFDPDYKEYINDFIEASDDPESLRNEIWESTDYEWNGNVLSKEIQFDPGGHQIDPEKRRSLMADHNTATERPNSDGTWFINVPINGRDVNLISGAFEYINRHLNANFPPEATQPESQ